MSSGEGSEGEAAAVDELVGAGAAAGDADALLLAGAVSEGVGDWLGGAVLFDAGGDDGACAKEGVVTMSTNNEKADIR
jgi:hypothetical protein